MVDKDKRFCSNCEHMFYYDWYNCSNKKFTSLTPAALPGGLYFDDYWGILRIDDEERSNRCGSFEPIKELESDS